MKPRARASPPPNPPTGAKSTLFVVPAQAMGRGGGARGARPPEREGVAFASKAIS